MKSIDLNGEWKFRGIRPSGPLPPGVNGKAFAWMDATVPGTVHTDLMAQGVIGDPFYRMQENDVQWVDSIRWEYRRDFHVAEEILRERAVDLVARGLDTFATIRCNGRVVGRSADMFVGHRFPLRRSLRAGRNTISILFDSPVGRAKQLEREHGRLAVALEPHRVYARKAQYSFSWDWGPKLTTSGIWRGIALEAYSGGRLVDPCAQVVSATPAAAVLRLSAGVQRTGARPLALRVFVGGPDRAVEYARDVRGKGAQFTVRIPEPHLWWPSGHGAQPIYTAVFSLLDGETVIDEQAVRFGIRTVKLLQEKDADGKSFILMVNGRRIFCKGADWIPSDSFLPRIPPATYDRLLRMARDANMNMIRVWGGGIYEEDLFYDLCDRLGLMVWQDFMFACGEYPETPAFLRLVRDEAEKAVTRLRNHPSIVLWCGNNECEWLYCTEHPGASPDDMRGARIFRDLLPAVVRRLDGTRPYWRSSPFGEGFPNSETNGNHHQWHVWSDWQDYPEYEKDTARFVTEFGFQGPADAQTMKAATLPGDRHVQSPVMEHHNKQVAGTERLLRFLAAHHALPGSFDDFIVKGQAVQAEALKTAAEHWRRRKYGTAGVLFWQLNDCWPVTSWSVIDSALRPKAAYYYARRFYAPVMVSIRSGGAAPEVWVTSDLAVPLAAEVEVALVAFSGNVLRRKRYPVRVKSDASVNVADVPWKEIRSAPDRYLRVRLETEDGAISENRLYFAEPKHLPLPEPGLTWSVSRTAGRLFAVTVHARRLARGVRVDVEGEPVVFDDNVFDLDGRSSKTVMCTSRLTFREFRRRLRVTALRKSPAA